MYVLKILWLQRKETQVHLLFGFLAFQLNAPS